MTRPPYNQGQASDLLRRLTPDLETLFRRFDVQADEVEWMVAEALVLLWFRGAYIRDPDAWFLDAIQHCCERLVEKRLESAEIGPVN